MQGQRRESQQWLGGDFVQNPATRDLECSGGKELLTEGYTLGGCKDLSGKPLEMEVGKKGAIKRHKATSRGAGHYYTQEL